MNNAYNAVKSNLTLANEEGSFGSAATLCDTEGMLCMGPQLYPHRTLKTRINVRLCLWGLQCVACQEGLSAG